MSDLSRDEQLVLRAAYELKKEPDHAHTTLEADVVAERVRVLDEPLVQELLLEFDAAGLVHGGQHMFAGRWIFTGLSPLGTRAARALPSVEQQLATREPPPAAPAGAGMRRTVAPSTWAARDLPVLVAAVSALDASAPAPWVHSTHIARDLGMDQAVVDAALRALEWTGYLELRHDSEGVDVVGATREAYQQAGLHPNPDTVAERFLAELQRLGRESDDPGVRAEARKVEAGIGSIGLGLVTNALWTAFTGQPPS